MRNRLYGGVRGRKMKVGRKLLHFPPTRLFKIVLLCCNTYRNTVLVILSEWLFT